MRFDLFGEKDDQGYIRSKIRITALNGTGVLLVPAGISLTPPVSSYERVMQIAPLEGYEESLVTDGGDSQVVYFRSADKKTYARFTANGSYNKQTSEDVEGTIYMRLYVNPKGSRNLLFDSYIELKNK